MESFSKSLSGAIIHYKSDITYNDARGRQFKRIDGSLDVRIFKGGGIHFEFWPDVSMQNPNRIDVQFNIDDLLCLQDAINLIKGIRYQCLT